MNNRRLAANKVWSSTRFEPRTVFQRRSKEWLRRWLKTPDQMLASDSTAQALLAQFNNTKMPNLHLSDKEVDALLHYIAQEDAKVHGS